MRSWYGRLAVVALLATFVAADFVLIVTPAAFASESAAPTPSPSALGDDERVDEAAESISAAQIAALIKGAFSEAPSIVFDRRPAPPDSAPMPITYGGKTPDGKFHLIAPATNLTCIRFASETEVDQAICFGAFLALGADSGGAGPELQRAYAEANDKPLFARILGRALQLQNETEIAKTFTDIHWMLSLRTGSKRADVYAKLRARKLVVYNLLYNPGKPMGKGGCDYGATFAASTFPTLGEPLPEPGCDARMAHVFWSRGRRNPAAPDSPPRRPNCRWASTSHVAIAGTSSSISTTKIV